MNFIDPHVHMVSRSTDDYEAMAMAGCVALSEPAFWAGYDRSSAAVFYDYFDHITKFEPARAADYGIKHYAWLCLNPKEGEDPELLREVLAFIPEFLERPNVVGIGEIGLNRVTKLEMEGFVAHVELAMQHEQLILIHTPHLEDKYKGTLRIVEALQRDSRVTPDRVLIDHAEEHTIGMIRDAGFWTGLTLYPQTKMAMDRAVDIVEQYGTERLCVNSACDWGPSVPLAVPQFRMAMRRRGHPDELIEQITFRNPAAFLGQSPRFTLA
jgi:predicted metal-dependent TIM-barrel fold hydrolase